MNALQIRRGEVYYAKLGPVIGSETGKTRPVVVIQNDIGNRYSPTTIVAVISEFSPKKAAYPICVPIGEDQGLTRPGFAGPFQEAATGTGAASPRRDFFRSAAASNSRKLESRLSMRIKSGVSISPTLTRFQATAGTHHPRVAIDRLCGTVKVRRGHNAFSTNRSKSVALLQFLSCRRSSRRTSELLS